MRFNVVDKEYTMHQMRYFCTKHLDMYPASSNKAIADLIMQRTLHRGSIKEVIRLYCCDLVFAGHKLPISAVRSKKLKVSADLRRIGNKLGEKNIITQTTPAVQAVMNQLDKLGIKYKREYPVVVKKKGEKNGKKLYIVDLYLPLPIKCIIELDGNHHYTPEGRAYDNERDALILKKEIGPIFRIENKVALQPDFDIVKVIRKAKFSRERIDKFLKEKRSQQALSAQ